MKILIDYNGHDGKIIEGVLETENIAGRYLRIIVQGGEHLVNLGKTAVITIDNEYPGHDNLAPKGVQLSPGGDWP